MKTTTRAKYLPAHIDRNRPNKTAKGMTATRARSEAHRPVIKGPIKTPSTAVIQLLVRGTTARAPYYLQGQCIEPVPCPCCGTRRPPNAKYRLTDAGRHALDSARARAAARAAARARQRTAARDAA